VTSILPAKAGDIAEMAHKKSTIRRILSFRCVMVILR
jgi:hypothetical protein